MSTPLVPQHVDRAHLAMELATRIYPVADICARHGITEQQVDHLLAADAQFAAQVAQYTREWESPMNTRARLKLKAEIAAEDGLATLYAIFRNPETPPPSRLEAYKQISQLADVLPKKEPGEAGGGSKFVFTVVLGDTDSDRLTVSATVQEDADEDLGDNSLVLDLPGMLDDDLPPDALDLPGQPDPSDPVARDALEAVPLPLDEWPTRPPLPTSTSLET